MTEHEGLAIGDRVYAHPVSERRKEQYGSQAEREADCGEGTVISVKAGALHGAWYRIRLDSGRVVERKRSQLAKLEE